MDRTYRITFKSFIKKNLRTGELIPLIGKLTTGKNLRKSRIRFYE
jgi:hypothetical protein